jgi:hypothetical protein
MPKDGVVTIPKLIPPIPDIVLPLQYWCGQNLPFMLSLA